MVDLSYLKELRGLGQVGNTDIVQTVIRIFLTTFPFILTSLEAALNEGNFAQTARFAHKLKSSAANLGACRLVELLDQIERFDESHSPDDRKRGLKSVRVECRKIQAELLKTQ